MSAVRRPGRSTARPSPYARPTSKKSSWSISSLLSYLNPLKSRTKEEELPTTMDESFGNDFNPEELGQSPAQALSTRGHQISRSLSKKPMEPEITTRGPPRAANPPPMQWQPNQQPSSNTFLKSASPTEDTNTFAEFLKSHRSSGLNPSQIEGIITELETPPRERFTFTNSFSAPSSPNRGNSPLGASTAAGSVPFRFSTPIESSNPTSTSTTPRLLKHNPNGTYRWQGGGSAKPPTRNRYQSPAFGSARASSERLVLRENPEKIKTDTKRRRVGPEAETSAASASGPDLTIPSARESARAPSPSPTRTAQAVPISTPNGNASSSSGKNNGNTTVSGSRLRTSGLQKPTTPAVPSPLRQAWGQSSTSSTDSEGGSPSAQPKQTRAANFMSELITQVKTTKHLEVSNPYQAASPVKTVGQPKPRSKRIRTTKKQETNGAEMEKTSAKGKEKETEKQYSAQAIIEATLPKGSKRSRPPANIGNGSTNDSSSSRTFPPSDSSPSREAPDTRGVQVEEVEDEDEQEHRSKKAKPNGHTVNGLFTKSPTKATAAPIIEEISDRDSSSKPAVKPTEIIEPDQYRNPFGSFSSTSSAQSKPAPALPLFGAPKANTAPKEPSKLRQSYQPTPSPGPSSSSTPTQSPFFPTTTSASVAPSSPFTTFTSATAPSPFNTAPAPPADAVIPEPKIMDPKEDILAMPAFFLPTFTFTVPSPITFNDVDREAMARAKQFPISELPKFDFSSSLPISSTPEEKKKDVTTPAPAPAPAVTGFNWAAAGMKPPALPEGSWKCKECATVNDASKTQCMVCDASPADNAATPTPAPSASSEGFNWAAAGMKPPAALPEGSWKCKECATVNDVSKTQCMVCEASPAGNAASPSPAPKPKPTQGFDWAAAGMKPPPSLPAGSWKCGTCDTVNGVSSMSCMSCSEPKP